MEGGHELEILPEVKETGASKQREVAVNVVWPADNTFMSRSCSSDCDTQLTQLISLV